MIILRKKKRLIEIFPIESSAGYLNKRIKPSFYGYLKIKQVNGQIKPYKFLVRKDKEVLFPPAEAIKILRKQNVILAGSDLEIEEMLKNLNIPYRKTRICNHCTLEGYITLIKRNKSYILDKEYICRICAEEEIRREMEIRGFDKRTFPSFKKILDRTNSLEEVLKLFHPYFNPEENPQLTLYDKISSKKDKRVPSLSMDQLPLSPAVKDIIKKQVDSLLPVQVLSLRAGLLEGENQLIVSATASGKTLIGELAGLEKALNGLKMIYLTPLVALANQKYQDFKKKYSPLGLKVAIRVGMSRIKAQGELMLPEERIDDADIIVGTYEGLDFLLRSGKVAELGEIGTVVVDEIHMLDDEDRGPRLDGLIRRLETLFPDLQLIGLSATIKNPQEIADKFKLKLVEYGQRPVPLERHLIFVRSEQQRLDIIRKLCHREYNHISRKGFHGQTMIFTNSRRKTHEIASYLERRGVTASAYHAGLSYAQKNRIEKDFLKQKISTVVTTAALAAGVDFPASQVIFESLSMGNQWLTTNQFHQMLGRAGRPSYHDLGIAYLLPEIGRSFEDESEDSVAIELLESDVELIEVHYHDEDVMEQILADICSGTVENLSELEKLYESVEIPLKIRSAFDLINDFELVKEGGERIIATPYGRAVSTSFLKTGDADYIHRNLRKMNPMELALNLEPFENAYLSPRLNNRLTRVLKINLSSRLFADSTLDIISSPDILPRLDPHLQERIINLQMEFFSCECKDKPFCTCFQAELSRKILRLRIQGKDPAFISRKLLRDYEIHTYSGDIFSWLDGFIRMVEAVKRISKAFKIKRVINQCQKLVSAIEQ